VNREEAIAEALARPERERAEGLHAEIVRRIELLQAIGSDPERQALALEMCRRDPVTFINDWVWTYNPRNPPASLPATVPLVLRPKQVEFVPWIDERLKQRRNGLIEKSRDEGATWVFCAWAVHHWLFWPGFKAGVGSRKLDLVDKSGDLDSIFEKIRFLIRHLPPWMLPRGFREDEHDNYCRLNNPKNGAAITGEGGTNIGRGGRSTVYLLDEHAHLEQAEAVEAALSQNTNCILYLSTPNGVGNLFYRKRFDGRTAVFTFNWRDNPDKNFPAEYLDEEGKPQIVYPWYEEQLANTDEVTVAQEIDIDYAASISGVVIPARWVQAAVDLRLEEGSVRAAGLDVSGEGADRTVYASRAGAVVLRIEPIQGMAVGDDVDELARQDAVRRLHYDRLGVGASITATLARRTDLPYRVEGIANSESPTGTRYDDRPDVPAEERFFNYAAELWWRLRLRFKASYERVTQAAPHPDDECISLAALAGNLELPVLMAQLSQPTYEKHGQSDKLRVNKKGHGSSSPDHAEALMYAFAAAPATDYAVVPAFDLTGGKQSTWRV
jgi:phage terminase large subunit